MSAARSPTSLRWDWSVIRHTTRSFQRVILTLSRQATSRASCRLAAILVLLISVAEVSLCPELFAAV